MAEENDLRTPTPRPAQPAPIGETGLVRRARAGDRDAFGEPQPDARALLRRRYWSDQQVKDLAGEGGRSEAAVTMTPMRLRQALQDCIERRLARGSDGR